MAKINENINSPNQSSRGTYKPLLIVCHLADGTYAGTKAWFNNPTAKTSSHYILAKDGRICQCVPLSKAAWCNGTSTDKFSKVWFGHSTVPLVKKMGGNANQYSVNIECEGFWKDGKGALTPAQLEALVRLIGHIQGEVKKIYGNTIPLDREHIVGHYQVNPKTKPHCPGERFPWNELMAKLNGGGQSVPPKPEQSPRSKRYKVMEQHGSYADPERAKAHVETLKAQGRYVWVAEE